MLLVKHGHILGDNTELFAMDGGFKFSQQQFRYASLTAFRSSFMSCLQQTDNGDTVRQASGKSKGFEAAQKPLAIFAEQTHWHGRTKMSQQCRILDPATDDYRPFLAQEFQEVAVFHRLRTDINGRGNQNLERSVGRIQALVGIFCVGYRKPERIPRRRR
jgi:hypothetical protein